MILNKDKIVLDISKISDVNYCQKLEAFFKTKLANQSVFNNHIPLGFSQQMDSERQEDN